MAILKRVGGLLAMCAGLALLGWVGWAMYQGDAPRRSGKAIVFGLTLAVLGAGWAFGLVGGDDDEPAPREPADAPPRTLAGRDDEFDEEYDDEFDDEFEDGGARRA